MKTLTKAALAATIATGLFASPSFAADAGTSKFTAKAVIVKPVTMTKTSDLDFGSTVMTSTLAAAGETVTVGDAVGDKAVCGSAQLVCSGGFPAAFDLTAGVGSETVQISFDTPPSVLTNTANPASTVKFDLNNPVEDVVLTSTGTGDFRVGGQITVVPGTDDGVYKAVVKVVANYQ
jgi:hypothetical protein